MPKANLFLVETKKRLKPNFICSMRCPVWDLSFLASLTLLQPLLQEFENGFLYSFG